MFILARDIPRPRAVQSSPMPPPLAVSRADARRFLVRAFALDAFQTLPSVADTLDTLGFVQEDSIHVCGRIHDLILWSRVRNYAPADLSRFLYEDAPRRAWEFYLPNLCVLPMGDYPYFVPGMRHRREREGRWGAMTPDEQAAADTLFARLDADGPLLLRDAKALGAEHGHTTSGWGTRTHMLSFVADKLFAQGRLGIARRDGFLRAFDRIERLLPGDALAAPVPTDAEAHAYLARKRLRARRLFRLRPADKAMLEEGETTAVLIEGDVRPWHVFTDDLPRLTGGDSTPRASETLNLLAPLDPLVYDRDRTRLLWDFDYIWEVYTPAAKRRWGYYVLPILWGDRLVGRVEPRLDKRAGTVTVVSLLWEPGFDSGEIRDALTERLADLAASLAC